MTNETNQTAVDIAFQKLASQGLLITRDYKNLVAYREAKEMEKEQHGKTWDNAIDNLDARGGNVIRAWVDFDEYYEQTYGGNK